MLGRRRANGNGDIVMILATKCNNCLQTDSDLSVYYGVLVNGDRHSLRAVRFRVRGFDRECVTCNGDDPAANGLNLSSLASVGHRHRKVNANRRGRRAGDEAASSESNHGGSSGERFHNHLPAPAFLWMREHFAANDEHARSSLLAPVPVHACLSNPVFGDGDGRPGSKQFLPVRLRFYNLAPTIARHDAPGSVVVGPETSATCRFRCSGVTIRSWQSMCIV